MLACPTNSATCAGVGVVMTGSLPPPQPSTTLNTAQRRNVLVNVVRIVLLTICQARTPCKAYRAGACLAPCVGDSAKSFHGAPLIKAHGRTLIKHHDASRTLRALTGAPKARVMPAWTTGPGKAAGTAGGLKARSNSP
jgi:hypothetical protein